MIDDLGRLADQHKIYREQRRQPCDNSPYYRILKDAAL
jgi:hypothetical protein